MTGFERQHSPLSPSTTTATRTTVMTHNSKKSSVMIVSLLAMLVTLTVISIMPKTTLLASVDDDMQRRTAFIRNEEFQCKDDDDYDGILFISRVIRKAGAGTMFFQSMVDSLLYAEKYNLYPFLWINDDENKPCYDPKVHGVGRNVTYSHLRGEITNVKGNGGMECDAGRDGTRPGPPSYDDISEESFTLIGNGLWQSYFLPISETPFDVCPSKPVFEMSRTQIMPAMHRCSELAVRGWTFGGIPDALLPNGLPIRDWLYQSRQRAAGIVKRYFHPQPWLWEKIHQANPNPGHCLAAHIRLTDKGSGRDKKGLEAYRPYIEAYAEASKGHPIYIATDDSSVLGTIINDWSETVGSRVIYQKDAFRSDKEGVPTFQLLENNKHRSNTESLVETYAMAQCSYFVHGYSGMAEAVVYINPKLHVRSVNIDDKDRPTTKEFERLVRKFEKMHKHI